MQVYEFELTNAQNTVTYQCIEAEDIESAEKILEREHEATDGSTYELYDVFYDFERRQRIAQEWEQELLTRLAADELAILEANIQSIRESGYATVVEKDTIRVYPTLDQTFKKE